MKRSHLTYLAQTQPGFEAIAADELERTLEGVTVRRTRSVADKNGMLLFDYSGDVRELLELRTIEDLFVVLTTLPDLPPTREALRLLEQAANRAGTLEPALALARQAQPGRGGRGKLRFRVVSRQVGRAAYRRVDAQRAIEHGIAARGDHRWQLAEDGALELWLTLLPNPAARSTAARQTGLDQSEAILALRLSDERMRHREYKIEHLPASLRPIAAAALAWLTRPADDDVFLDPMCGAATILIERAHLGRYKLLLGGDAREEALEVARANVGPRYKPIELRQWDARDLPLDAGSASAVAVNLPFGRQIGTPEQNRALYPVFLREMARVLRPGGRMVALTGDGRTFTESLRRANNLARRQTYSVQVLGQSANIYVLERV
ncbi:MAG TPA: methyltransferase domain-containing protein [Roseiflexaceae bacterium]|nr:methyltransferase domain-containing protein [Roseiflexaceae bacterium]